VNDANDHVKSQYFRRYGHSFDLQTIEDVGRIGVAVATAKASMGITVTQALTDALHISCGQPYASSSSLMSTIFPRFILALLEWADSSEEADQPDRAFYRMQLQRIQEVFTSSKRVCGNTFKLEEYIQNLLDVMTVRLRGAYNSMPPADDFIKDSEMNLESDIKFPPLNDNEIYDLKMHIRLICDYMCCGSRFDIKDFKKITTLI